MKSLYQISEGMTRRINDAWTSARLNLRYALQRKTVWIDYGHIRLPFHRDGDLQELFYHSKAQEWYSNERSIFQRFLKNGDVAIDVGANLGFLTTIMSALVGEQGTVHSFEPSPKTFPKLLEVIKANRLTNVKAYNLGCGERKATQTMFTTNSSGLSTLNLRPDLKDQIVERCEVEVIVLDQYLAPQLERLDFLKLDTEGFEGSVLAGGSELLARFRPVVYIELGSEYLASSRRAVTLLKDLGYRFESEPILEESFIGQNYIAWPA